MDSPSPVDTSRTPKDIFNEPPEDLFSDPLSDTNSEPQKNVDTKISSPVSDEDSDLFSDPLDDETNIISPTESKNPVPDLLNESQINSEPPKSDVVVEPSDISKPGHKTDVGDRQKGIFEDLPIDGNKGVSIKTAASSELLDFDDEDDEDDEDLFKEPFKAVSKKPSGPPVDVFTELKSEGKGKAQGKNAPDDLFEEALTAPGNKSSAGAVSKTNGVHSEEQDLFTGTS